jgi:hypothetical protein
MIDPGNKPPWSPARPLLVIWLVLGAGMIATPAAFPGVLVALLLTLLLLNLSYRRRLSSRSKARGIGRPARDDRSDFEATEDRWAWFEGYLSKLRVMRRRMRMAGGPITLANIPGPGKRPQPSDRVPSDRGQEPAGHARDDRGSGVLLLLAFQASVLIVLALISAIARLAGHDDRILLFQLLELFGVIVLPVVVGIGFRCALHSILVMIAVSAAIQTLLFQTTASVPDPLFLGLAAGGLLAVPLGLAQLFSTIDRLPRGEVIETTTGKLLESHRDRSRTRSRGRPSRAVEGQLDDPARVSAP